MKKFKLSKINLKNTKKLLNKLTKKWYFRFSTYLIGTILVVLATIIPVMETYFNRFIIYLEKKPTALEIAQNKIDKIRTGYRIQAIEQTMGFTPQRLSTWKDCKEYSWIDKNYIVQVATDMNDISYSYSIISLKEDFNLKPRFAPKIILNKSTFKEHSDSFRSRDDKMIFGYRGDEGYYSEVHSNLGGTTNYTNIEFINNFNFSLKEIENRSNQIEQELLKINAATYTDNNISAANVFYEKEIADCKAEYGKGNVLFWEKYNELGELEPKK